MENTGISPLQLIVQEPDKISEKPSIQNPPEKLDRKPAIDESPELQRKYIDIYLMRIVQGESVLSIAKKKEVDEVTVRAALRWCRGKSDTYVWIEALTDALNALDYRMGKLESKQAQLRAQQEAEELALKQVEADLKQEADMKKLEGLRDLRNEHKHEINVLHRWILLYEDKIQATLDKKFNMQNLYKKQLIDIPQENFQLNSITTFTANIKAVNMTQEDRDAIARILERTYRRKI